MSPVDFSNVLVDSCAEEMMEEIVIPLAAPALSAILPIPAVPGWKRFELTEMGVAYSSFAFTVAEDLQFNLAVVTLATKDPDSAPTTNTVTLATIAALRQNAALTKNANVYRPPGGIFSCTPSQVRGLAPGSLINPSEAPTARGYSIFRAVASGTAGASWSGRFWAKYRIWQGTE